MSPETVLSPETLSPETVPGNAPETRRKRRPETPETRGLHGEASYHVVDRALESIRKMPELAPVYHGHFRRKLVSGTPYGIFYSIMGKRLMVSFIMDLRQNPAKIEQRLAGR